MVRQLPMEEVLGFDPAQEPQKENVLFLARGCLASRSPAISDCHLPHRHTRDRVAWYGAQRSEEAHAHNMQNHGSATVAAVRVQVSDGGCCCRSRALRKCCCHQAHGRWLPGPLGCAGDDHPSRRSSPRSPQKCLFVERSFRMKIVGCKRFWVLRCERGG